MRLLNSVIVSAFVLGSQLALAADELPKGPLESILPAPMGNLDPKGLEDKIKEGYASPDQLAGILKECKNQHKCIDGKLKEGGFKVKEVSAEEQARRDELEACLRSQAETEVREARMDSIQGCFTEFGPNQNVAVATEEQDTQSNSDSTEKENKNVYSVSAL